MSSGTAPNSARDSMHAAVGGMGDPPTMGTSRTALPLATPLTIYHSRVIKMPSESILFSSAILRALRATILS